MKQRMYVHEVPVTYAESGAGEACILVHGAGANRNYWKSLAGELGDVRTIVPDLYGHGDTPPWRPGPTGRGAYAYADDVDLLAQIATKIAGPFSLVGHSSGGAVCLEYARLHPDRVTKLVVAEPMLPTILAARFPDSHAQVCNAYERAHEAVGSGRFADAARCLFEYILGDGQWDQLAEGTRAWMAQNVELTLAAHSRASLALAVEPSRYATIRCPVLLLCGESTRPPFRAICDVLAASLPDVRLVVVRGGSHNAPITHAPHVNSEIVKFLAR